MNWCRDIHSSSSLMTISVTMLTTSIYNYKHNYNLETFATHEYHKFVTQVDKSFTTKIWHLCIYMHLASLPRSISIKCFMRGTILFKWPWRCRAHLSVIWIILSRNMLVFFIRDDWEAIYLCFFAFNFLSSVLVLFLNMF
jgi:hypothetical protein